MTRQYIFTERAHLMCPNMYFGIVEVVNSPFDVAHIQCVFQKLSNSHPFLKALLGYEREKNQYYYDITDNSKTEITLKDVEVSSIQDQVIFDEYKKLTRRDWNLVYEGMLKVVCWKMKNRTCILFVFHHLLADGRAALGLAREFAQLYVRGREPKPVLEQLISSMNDLPIGSKLSTISKMLINKCNKNWLKESHIVTYDEYHAFLQMIFCRMTRYPILFNNIIRRN